MKILKLAISLLVFLLFFIVFEFVSFLYLSSQNKGQSLFFNKPAVIQSFQNEEGKEIYKDIDPLLGWSINQAYSSSLNLVEEANSFVLRSSNSNCPDPLIIYISGGSTSDIVFDAKNWPVSFHRLLDDNRQCYKIYVGAVAGYSSGQELLKLIRDMDKIKPDIHISYSGVNEMSNPSYVSDYELYLFTKLLASPKFLPNTLTLLKGLASKESDAKLHFQEKYEGVDYWIQNMKNMEALAEYNNYTFVGILQPVFNYDTYLDSSRNETLHYFAKEYNQFYPEAKRLCMDYTFLYDQSNFFKNYPPPVFKDDCHLSDVRFQKAIAQEIFNIINLNN
jgi:hypothetical protein